MFYKTSIFIKVSVSIINWTILNLSYTRYVYVIDDNQFCVLLIPNIKCSPKIILHLFDRNADSTVLE